MPIKSSIHALPPELKARIDFILTNTPTTLDDIVAEMEAAGHTLSRSALGRYKKHVDKMSERLRASREMTEVFARELGDTASQGKTSRALSEQVRMFAMDFMLKVGASVDDEGNPVTLSPKDINDLGRGLAALALHDRRSLDFENQIRKQIRDEEREAAAAAANEAVSSAVLEKGLTEEQAGFIRAKILGIKVDPDA